MGPTADVCKPIYKDPSQEDTYYEEQAGGFVRQGVCHGAIEHKNTTGTEKKHWYGVAGNFVRTQRLGFFMPEHED